MLKERNHRPERKKETLHIFRRPVCVISFARRVSGRNKGVRNTSWAQTKERLGNYGKPSRAQDKQRPRRRADVLDLAEEYFIFLNRPTTVPPPKIDIWGKDSRTNWASQPECAQCLSGRAWRMNHAATLNRVACVRRARMSNVTDKNPSAEATKRCSYIYFINIL